MLTLGLTSVLTLLGPLAVLPATAAAQDDSEQTELGLRMEDLNTPWRRLRRQVDKADKNAASVELLAQMREAAVAAGSMIPARTASIPEAQRERFQADYEAGMKKLVDQIDAISAALQAGDNAKAAELVGEMDDFRRDAHERFKADN